MTTSTKETSYVLENYELENALKAFLAGKIVLHPTDTLWSLSCDASDEKAVQQLLAIRKKEEHLPFELLVSSVEMLKKYVIQLHPRLETLLAFHQRPLSILFNNVNNLPLSLTDRLGSLPVRLVRDPFCCQLIEKLDKPLLSTSANLSGQDFPPYFGAISSAVIHLADYVVKYKQQEKENGTPSVLVQLAENDELEFIRE